MTLEQAVKSGKPFKRPVHSTFYHGPLQKCNCGRALVYFEGVRTFCSGFKFFEPEGKLREISAISFRAGDWETMPEIDDHHDELADKALDILGSLGVKVKERV